MVDPWYNDIKVDLVDQSINLVDNWYNGSINNIWYIYTTSIIDIIDDNGLLILALGE